MGAWGPGISSNETFEDITYEFFELYNDGLTPEQVTNKLIADNQKILDDEEDRNNFWFALALAQWECKALDPELFTRVRTIIETGQDIEIWKELGASNPDLSKRQKVLEGFLQKLSADKKAPRKRKKKILRNSVFQAGDCLAYRMDNGNFGAALVLTDERDTEVGANCMAITAIDSPTKPSIEEILSSDIYIKHENETRFENNRLVDSWVDKPQIGCFSAINYKRDPVEIYLVGQVKLSKLYTNDSFVFRGFSWSHLQSMIPFKSEYIKINGSPKLKMKLKELL